LNALPGKKFSKVGGNNLAVAQGLVYIVYIVYSVYKFRMHDDTPNDFAPASVPASEFDKLRAVGARGDRMMYPFNRIEVGQGFHVPLTGYRNRTQDEKKTMRQLYLTLHRAAYRLSKSEGLEFSIFQDGGGYTVIRLN
tara:strand:- start:753 stop:1166 length:414 start_codon:yes stop_codon:yes gene_type:complete